jgi:hypothetical protein
VLPIYTGFRTRPEVQFNSTASQVWSGRLDAMTTRASLASPEGNLREGLDPYVVSESIVNAMLGAELLSKTAGGNGHIKRLTRSLQLLPGNRCRHIAGLLSGISCPRVPAPPPGHRPD